MSFNKQSWAPHRRDLSHVRRDLGVGQAAGCTVGASFNGSTSEIHCGGNDFTATAFTLGGYFYINSLASDSALLVFEDQGVAYRLTVVLTTTGAVITDSAGANAFSPTSLISAGNSYALFVTKAAGTATPRLHFTTNGSSWTHTNYGGTLGNPTGTISRIDLGHQFLFGSVGNPFNGEIWSLGMWAEDTTDGNIQTYLDYDVLAAKTNAQFFTAKSLTSAGTVVDAGSLGNNEVGRANISTGAQCIPSWITNFGAAGPTGPGIIPKTRMHRLVPIMQKQQY